MQTGLTLWILEDDPATIFMYQDYLGLRYKLTLFPNIEELKSKIDEKTNRPDLLIADLRLPDGNFLEFISKDPSSYNINFPIIIVSYVDDIEILRMAYKEGVSDFITKPFSTNQLIAKIENILCKKEDIAQMNQKDDFILPDDLSERELGLLKQLIISEDHSLPASKIRSIAGRFGEISEKTLPMHMSNLRKKLKPKDADIIHIAPDSYKLVNLSYKKLANWMKQIDMRQ